MSMRTEALLRAGTIELLSGLLVGLVLFGAAVAGAVAFTNLAAEHDAVPVVSKHSGAGR